jgi:5-methylcytosine-specific restriction endonuclease McrA
MSETIAPLPRTSMRIPASTMRYLLRVQKVCQRCGSDESLTGDHIVPRTAGGRNTVSNTQLLCRSCNSRKGRLEDRIDRRA